MAKENIFEGFEAMSSLLTGKPGDTEGKDDFEEIDPEEIKQMDDGTEDVELDSDGNPIKDEDDTDDDVDTDVDTDDDTDDDVDLSENEEDITEYLKQRLSEEIGVPLDEEIKDLEGLVKHLEEVVITASKPVYASPEIEALNKFVTDGGKLEDFYKAGETGVDIDTIDIDNETDQKAAIKERLVIQGYSEEKAKRTIARYEDAGVLEEEAEDSVEFLKEYKTKNKEKLLEDTAKKQEAFKKEQQIFVENVEKIVDNTDSIRGIKISSNEKKELLDYIFKPGPDGKTQYQKDYGSDVKNLIESAYFTKKGDVLIERAKKQASSDAHKELHKKIKASKDKRQKGSRSGGFGSGDHAGLSSLSKALLNK